jgi:hypothetical protein
MTETEYQRFLTAFINEFETLGKRLAKRGQFAQEWRYLLLPLAQEEATTALRQWLRISNTEPTIERFAALIETQREHRRQTRTSTSATSPSQLDVADTLTRLAASQRSPNDILWARLHIQLFHALAGKPAVERNRLMFAAYTRWQTEYPALAEACRTVLADSAPDCA